MGQIIGSAAKPKRCNLSKLSQLGTPAAGEHILVSTDNSMNAAGQGNFDAYIVGNGTTVATALPLHYLADNAPTEGSVNPVSSDGVWQEVAMRPYVSVTPTALSGLRIANPVTAAGSETLYYIPVKSGQTVNILANFTSGYFMRSGITTVVPARFVAATTFPSVAASDGSGVVIQRTAASDGYFCVSFTTSSLTSLLLYFESDTIGINVYKMRPKVAEIDKKVPILLGKNLFDKTKITTGVYFNSGGTTSVSGNYAISDFIEIEDEQNYCITDSSGSSVGVSGYIVFYDSNKTKQSVIADTKTFTVPAGAKYVRFSIGYYTNKIDSVMLEKGSTRTEYEPFNIAGGYLGNCVTPKQLEISLSDKLDVNTKNLFDESAIEDNKCLLAGETSSNSSYFISDYIPVEAGENYTQSAIYNGGERAFASSQSVYMAFYNSDKQEISGIRQTVYNHKTFTPPANAYYVRITGQKAFSKFQVEKGSERTEYIKYSPIAGYPLIIPAGSIGFDELTDAVKENINATKPISFHGLRASATTLAANETLTLSQLHVIKNAMLSAKVYGVIDSISVGVGYSETSPYRNYDAHWLTIGQSDVKLYYYNGESIILSNTYTHGLTLTSKTVIEVDSVIDGNAATHTLRIFNDVGDMFTQVLSGWGQGTAFATNGGNSSIDVALAFMPRDITKNVWCFGDSYFNFTSASRWPYYAAQAGMIAWFSNNHPGLSPDSAYTDLQTMIGAGYRPAFLVWCLGMNGGGDTESGGEYIINSGQKTVIDNVLALCETYNITPILATIPTVPSRQKTGFCNYVKSLGVRYIDFAEAVGATSAGVWNTGLLSSDEVHPTAAGAKVLFSQVLIDFPEISVKE